MFAPRYFAGRYFSRRYFPRGGTAILGMICGTVSAAARIGGKVTAFARIGGTAGRVGCG